MSQTQEKLGEHSSESSRGERSLPEKISFGIALGILATVIGLVIYVWVAKEGDRPPELAIEQTEPTREAGGQFYVPFQLTNTGGGTAEAVRVTAELYRNGEVMESGEQEFEFLSGDETEEGEFVFSENPQQGEVRLRVTGYRLP